MHNSEDKLPSLADQPKAKETQAGKTAKESAKEATGPPTLLTKAASDVFNEPQMKDTPQL